MTGDLAPKETPSPSGAEPSARPAPFPAPFPSPWQRRRAWAGSAAGRPQAGPRLSVLGATPAPAFLSPRDPPFPAARCPRACPAPAPAPSLVPHPRSGPPSSLAASTVDPKSPSPQLGQQQAWAPAAFRPLTCSPGHARDSSSHRPTGYMPLKHL